MSHTHPKELLQLVEAPEHNRDFTRSWHPDAPEMSQREINNHIKAVFNKERELMRASKES